MGLLGEPVRIGWTGRWIGVVVHRNATGTPYVLGGARARRDGVVPVTRTRYDPRNQNLFS
jgi:hypothetical protein